MKLKRLAVVLVAVAVDVVVSPHRCMLPDAVVTVGETLNCGLMPSASH